MNEHRKLPRRRHSAQFKREVLAACNELGASVAGVALAFGLNANLVRQWRRGRGFKPAGGAAMAATSVTREAQQQFIALSMPQAVAASAAPANVGAGDIRIEVRRGALQVSVSWPQAAAADCAIWLRELLK
ncbi:IS66-like element accessory protein TnpA [Hydrogenophaga intermedia]|jgi:transposase|uniref:IS66-like element accessory protein TnpA n=1 Tax=Hydrogenophaga intermedia TaxID=65786 RepID=UPI0020443628|nr:transposase [Hydrogenophaga intermedia]MCM3566261.1 transposase [Hydrogenophaga intermedia]